MSLHRPITPAMIICNSINAPDVREGALIPVCYSQTTNPHLPSPLYLSFSLCSSSLSLSLSASLVITLDPPPTALTRAFNRIELYDHCAIYAYFSMTRLVASSSPRKHVYIIQNASADETRKYVHRYVYMCVYIHICSMWNPSPLLPLIFQNIHLLV